MASVWPAYNCFIRVPTCRSMTIGSCAPYGDTCRTEHHSPFQAGDLIIVSRNYICRSSLFLAHEMAVRDVRVCLEAAGAGGYEVESWRDGGDAAIRLRAPQGPPSARPDARFVYHLGGVVLVGIVEVD